MKETYIKDILKEDLVGKEVSIKGWVYRMRDMKDKVFFVIRDPTGIIQAVVKKDNVNENIWNDALKFQIEGSLELKGILKKDERAPTGYEIEVKDIKVYDYGQPFPLKGDEEIDTIQKYRHLWIRTKWFVDILKVKHSLLKNLREWYINDGWYEVQPPILVGNAAENTTELFEVKYFDQKAYLSQSAQLYLEALIFSLGKVYSLTPSFRAEFSRTKRHLHEYWHFEIEAAWYHLEDLIKAVEESLKYSIEKTIEERKSEFEDLKSITGRDIKELKDFVEKPWKILKYEDGIKKLKDLGINIRYGDDLGSDEERILTQQFDVPIFLTYYPREVKAFYMYENGDGTVKNFDLLAPEGYGEIIGGSEREWRYNILDQKIKEWKLDSLKIEVGNEEIDAYEWYKDLRRYGSVPHSGMGLGLERFTRWICKMDHIRDTLAFPRLRGGWLYP
ncbi:asparagine--tRNA ligase [Nanobdella aerobiophila]|uniref:Asparagine--tRNA ligase n=2 Tax=Nanobdella aerobiophila TaxID=2586965 RepID=A0A915WSI6_9ARCH|nr:asparagine--tRNA ligase [Nanobdella aerobiophila]